MCRLAGPGRGTSWPMGQPGPGPREPPAPPAAWSGCVIRAGRTGCTSTTGSTMCDWRSASASTFFVCLFLHFLMPSCVGNVCFSSIFSVWCHLDEPLEQKSHHHHACLSARGDSWASYTNYPAKCVSTVYVFIPIREGKSYIRDSVLRHITTPSRKGASEVQWDQMY